MQLYDQRENSLAIKLKSKDNYNYMVFYRLMEYSKPSALLAVFLV